MKTLVPIFAALAFVCLAQPSIARERVLVDAALNDSLKDSKDIQSTHAKGEANRKQARTRKSTQPKTIAVDAADGTEFIGSANNKGTEEGLTWRNPGSVGGVTTAASFESEAETAASTEITVDAATVKADLSAGE